MNLQTVAIGGTLCSSAFIVGSPGSLFRDIFYCNAVIVLQFLFVFANRTFLCQENCFGRTMETCLVTQMETAPHCSESIRQFLLRGCLGETAYEVCDAASEGLICPPE